MAIKYKWLAGHLREQLPDYTANGIHRLPTEAAISQRYKVSRQTVRQALSVLEQEGLIEKRQGSGSYITGRSRGEDRIDLLLSNDSAYLYPMLLHDIKKTLAAQGFSTTVHITENTFSTEHTLLQKILHQPPRALLVEGVKTARTNPNLDLYRKLQKKKCPVLFLQESYPELTNCPCVTMDDFGGGILLTRHLLATGHTRIGAIFPADMRSGLLRCQGMLHALRDTGALPEDSLICWYFSNDPDYGIQKAMQKLISSCTAIVCYNDTIAYALCRAVSDLPQPPEITVASFDHSYLCHFGHTEFLSLTPAEAPGSRAAGVLLHQLQGILVSSTEIPWKL